MPIPSTYRQTEYGDDVPSDVFLPKGIESVLEYNGLVLNDRRRLDRYVVQRITGLGDADLRDSREPNPDRDGETPYKALYSGRTITLQGYMEAGNLRMLRYMSHQLKKAFSELQERPLRFYFEDWLEMWDNPMTAGEYQILQGDGSFMFANGQIEVSDTSIVRLLLNRKIFKDFQVTMEYTPRANATNPFDVLAMGRYVDDNNYLLGGLSSNHGLTVATVIDGSTAYYFSDTPPAMVLDRKQWIRWTCLGDYQRIEYFPPSENPHVGGKASDYVQATVPEVLDTSGKMGVRYKGSHQDWSFGTFEIAAVPGDQQIFCRKVASIEGDEEQTNDRFRRPFLLSLRASSDLQVSKSWMHISNYLGLAELIFPANGIVFDENGNITFGQSSGIAHNYGFAPARPVIRFRPVVGSIVNPAVVNLTNDSRIVIDGTISSEWLEIDCDTRTVVDDQGRNMYHLISPQTNWLTLEPGPNLLASGADANASDQSGGDFHMRWRHSTR